MRYISADNQYLQPSHIITLIHTPSSTSQFTLRRMPFRKFSFKDLILTTFCILFTAVLYYRDFAVVDFNKLYLVIATFGVAVVLDYKRVIYLLCFLFPLSCGIPSNFIYPLLICILFIKDPQKLLNKVVLFIVIFLMEISHYGYYTFDIQIAEIVGYASFLFLMFYICCACENSLFSLLLSS